MVKRNWVITGVSSGFGYEMVKQVLSRGDNVLGTVRKTQPVEELIARYPDNFHVEIVDMRDRKAVTQLGQKAEELFSTIDVIVSNAGYGLFGAAEELSDEEIDDIIATNLTGSIDFIRAFLPVMRKRRQGRIIQISSYGGEVAFAGNSLYHATKWGIEGFCDSLSQEMAPFNIGVTIVEPGGARTEFRYKSAKIAKPIKAYDNTPAHAFQKMLDRKNGLAAGDPKRMAARIIESVDITPAPLRMVLGSGALKTTIEVLEKRLEDFKGQEQLAASTDF
ncbi:MULTISPECIES: SDR family oxidoreductase [Bartonella]|uniref:SDR family oxidoreductase n=1 Tax=Bartonella TaxID=773 RepID=UPI0018DD4AF7|nr:MULTISPECIES: SDR family oxidoreductase [Bartonella]MBH9993752.1 SDR family oxidoreductase [Bartonella sp. P0291]MBH9997902.1 SDR family oxidoreductase [Bartonella sp. M0192]MBI0000061.1 SDR family oxidoreductase [Bartonella sp. M0191]MBI0007624.1 SDR family oxidoreductase [Bartonella sp. M0193]MBI0011352.1 SDR family oxidoreductase [Bartonella sp. M0176]